MNSRQNRILPLLTVLLALVLGLILIVGCGKKAPPVAPRKMPLTGLKDLQGQLNQGTVRLTWHHSPENAQAVGYLVLRAHAALDKPECPDCPMVFQKVDTIIMGRDQRKQRHAMEFYQDLAPGFRYTFNVRPYQSSGNQGPDSNLVVITQPKN